LVILAVPSRLPSPVVRTSMLLPMQVHAEINMLDNA
jgi:hypothetical protein